MYVQLLALCPSLPLGNVQAVRGRSEHYDDQGHVQRIVSLEYGVLIIWSCSLVLWISSYMKKINITLVKPV